jgi:hypothetical protein
VRKLAQFRAMSSSNALKLVQCETNKPRRLSLVPRRDAPNSRQRAVLGQFIGHLDTRERLDGSIGTGDELKWRDHREFYGAVGDGWMDAQI